MAGIYIHIPFCKSKCAYCSFFSSVDQRQCSEYIDALKREALSRRTYIGDEEVHTIYFGGGTPSLLTAKQIDSILKLLKDNYNIDSEPEITLEANPDTIDRTSLKDFKEAGINRISIGIQSFFDDDLIYLCRRHNSQHALQVIDDINAIGFSKSTLDLIYGIPTLTDEKWNKNLDIFFSTGMKHLSAYALTIENNTVLGQSIAKGTAKAVNEDESIHHYEILTQRTEQQGFIHYEISNFAMPGHYSKHNSIYWTGGNYLGLGAAAHSYNGISRQWNVSNIKQYIKTAGVSNSIIEKESLSLNDRYNEYVMTSLRTSFGCDTEQIRNSFGNEYASHFERLIKKYLDTGMVKKKNSTFILSNHGMLFADGIAAELFI